MAEFMPPIYLKDPQTVASWKFGLTTVTWRKEDLKKRLEKSKRLVSGEEQVELNPSGEEGILLIKALCGLTRVISNVNIPNTAGQIPNLPKSGFVERFPELSLFYRLFSPLNSEMICIFPYFCPYAESAREIREIFS